MAATVTEELKAFIASAIKAERNRIADMLRSRGKNALAISAKRGHLFPASEASRLKQWLDAAAHDVEQGLD